MKSAPRTMKNLLVQNTKIITNDNKIASKLIHIK